MKLALLLLLSLALPATAQEGKSYGAGIFTRIVLDGVAQVRLTQGQPDQPDQVFVPGGPEVQNAIEFHQSGNRIVITAGSSWKFWSANKTPVDVRVRDLEDLNISGASDVIAAERFKVERLRVNISGSGSVRFDDLQADQLRFEISGAGDGQLAGSVSDLRLGMSGKGKMVADQLRATRANVSISGVGNAQVWATDKLSINVSGVGTVDYWGAPQVLRNTSGLATINSRGDKR
ncbi:MAG: DUF2807 domain-containing protein [Betaproteobacteria bacterium]|nr:DUF2807 domain-containing protein [Betaproteobacteria bacterium]